VSEIFGRRVEYLIASLEREERRVKKKLQMSALLFTNNVAGGEIE
jgi:hypothetical protein